MSALAFGSIMRRDGRATPLVERANELAKLLSCVPASSESRIRSLKLVAFASIYISIITGLESRRLQ